MVKELPQVQDTSTSIDLIIISIENGKSTLSLDVSLWLIAIVIIAGFLIFKFLKPKLFRRYTIKKLDISLGKIGKVELVPNTLDLQIAHRIWTELITRKAAIPFDPDNDVIIEVYNSWYVLFTNIRNLIAEIPAELLKKEDSTRKIVEIATQTLNQGLRPHLTQWQARFRNWYRWNDNRLEDRNPQELQREYPNYDELVADMILINGQLQEYAVELKKLFD